MAVKTEVQLVRVQEANCGQRLDNFLIRQLKGVPRARVYRLIRRGEVRVNKKRCKPEQKLELGDAVRIPPFQSDWQAPTARPSPALEQMLRGRLLFEDEDLLVLDKPAGLAVHGGSGIRLGLIEALRKMSPEWQQAELVHRLDRDTSGCLLVSKNTNVLKDLQEQFKLKTVKKNYLALVHGQWPDEVTEINAPLRKNELSSGERMVRVRPDGKSARTRFRVVKRFEMASLVEASPETGRTHQIRVHCECAGHAIVGDAKYGMKSEYKVLNQTKSLCLHASELGFILPGDGRLISVSAPMPESFESLINKINKKQ